MIKPNKNLSFKKIKKIYHEEVKQEQPVVEEIQQPEVLPEVVTIVEEKQPEPVVQVVEGTEDLVNEFLSAIGASGLVEVVSKPAEPKVKADASAFVDPAKLDDFLKSIQEEAPAPIPSAVTQSVQPTIEEVVQSPTPLTKQVVNLTKPSTKKSKSSLDPNIKAINDRLGLFEKRLGELAVRPAGQDAGGGETRLRFLDDIDRSSIVDGWFLKYNDTTKKFDFASPTAASFNPTDIRGVYAEVKNADNVTIHKGDPVYLYRATGNKASVILASNVGDPTSAKTLGLAYSTFEPGQTGLVITKGVLTGIDTSMYGEGDTLYLGATAGTLTNVKPYSPNHLVYIGVVERANQGQGQIYVSPQNGYELEELHNVNIDHHTALADGHYLRWVAEHSQWINTPFPSLFSGSYNDLTDRPSLFSGSYNDLTNKPSIPTVPTSVSSFTNDAGYLTTVSWSQVTGKPTLFSGSYNDLTDKPTIPSLTGYATESYVSTAISNVIGAAPEALNTLKEIADQLSADESVVSSLTTTVAGKVSLTGSYADPTWITSLAYSKITGAPTALSSFTNDSGYITSTSTLVNGSYSLTVNSNGTMTLPNSVINTGTSAVSLWSTNDTGAGLTWRSPTGGGAGVPWQGTLYSGNTGIAISLLEGSPSAGISAKTWTFGFNGRLTFPDSTYQTTAYTGNAATVTNGVYTTDTATVTNTMLAGSIANNKLANSSITINSTAVSLGGSITGIVTTSDSATVTNTMLAGSIANSKLANSSITIGTTAINLGSSSTSLAGMTSIDGSGTVTLFNSATTLTLGYTGGSGSNTTNIVTAPQFSGTTKTLNIGTGGVAGSTTNINLGATAGTSTVTINGTLVGSATTQNVFNTTATTVNAFGAATALSIGAATGTTTVNNNLAVSGQVTAANLTGFRVYGSGTTNNLTTTQNTYGAINSNNFTVDFQQGTALNTTTGVFTAPTTGLYQVNIVGRNAGYSGGISQLGVLKNGSSGGLVGGTCICMIEFAANSTMNHAGASTVIKLTAGDTLACKILAGQINFDGNDNWSIAFLG